MKQFSIIVVPCSAGWEYGYVARCGMLSFWARTREEVISDMLDRLTNYN